MNAVILAGGGGTRLWPLSRQQRPKQFQTLVGDTTLLELTLMRLGSFFRPEQIFYSVTPETKRLVHSLLPTTPEAQYLVEPEKRDTGPAMGYVAALLALTDPDEPLVFCPSDHYIRNHERFQASLQVADDLIRETGALIDIGVVPTWPNENLGYTHVGERRMERNGVEVHAFRGHTEKPPREQAEEFLASGEYLWHANYYMWTPRKFLEAYERHAPETYATLMRIQELHRKGDRAGVAAAYATLEKVSIDYAITEKLDPADVLIIRAPFDWSDVGMWGTLKELREENPDDNVTQDCTFVGVDTRDTLVYGQDPKKVIATIGVEHLVVVDTGDALLICDKRRDQDLKLLVEELKRRGLDAHL